VVDDSQSSGVSAAKEFLRVLRADETINRRLDQAVDDQILAVSRVIAAERGFHFSRDDLVTAVADELSFVDFALNDPDGGPGHCKSDSGCRTPCVYCKSNAVPTEGDLGIIFEERRQLG
jgi:hypothetical protein